MGTVAKCPKCGKIWWIGGGMLNSPEEGSDEIRYPKDRSGSWTVSNFYCKDCDVPLTGEGVPLILWD